MFKCFKQNIKIKRSYNIGKTKLAYIFSDGFRFDTYIYGTLSHYGKYVETDSPVYPSLLNAQKHLIHAFALQYFRDDQLNPTCSIKREDLVRVEIVETEDWYESRLEDE